MMLDETAPGPGLSLTDALQILKRRWLPMGGCLVAGTAIGLAFALILPSVYSTKAQVVVNPPLQVQPRNQEEAQQSLGTYLAILRSRSFEKRLRDKVPAQYQDDLRQIDYAAGRSGTVISISVDAMSPTGAAAWANTAANEFVTAAKDEATASVREKRKFLLGAISDARTTLAMAEKKRLFAQSRVDSDEAGNSAQDRTGGGTDLVSQEQQTRGQVVVLDTKVRRLRQRLALEPETVDTVVRQPNPELEELRAQIARLKAEKAVALGIYLPTSTKIENLNEQIGSLDQQLKATRPEIESAQKNANPARAALEAQLRDLELEREAMQALGAQLAPLAAGARATGVRVSSWRVQLNQLERERDLAEKTYSDYAERLRELEIQERGLSAPASVMEEADVPGEHSQPNRTALVGMGILCGLGLGVFLAWLLEHCDDRIRTPVEIQRLVGLPTLGYVPSLDKGDAALEGSTAMSPLRENFRALRYAVRRVGEDLEVRSVLVTSSQPGEGKSHTSANLAMALARSRDRVVLVDADLRRPMVHTLFGIPLRPGLVDVLEGRVELSAALRPGPVEGMQILPAGEPLDDPGELLGDGKLATLIGRLQAETDMVVFDSPPIIGFPEVHDLAALADGTLLVVESGRTNREQLQRSMYLLEHSDGRVLGAVLNRTENGTNTAYYRYPYRYRGRYERAGGNGMRNGSNGSNGSNGHAAGTLPTEPAGAPNGAAGAHEPGSHWLAPYSPKD